MTEHDLDTAHGPLLWWENSLGTIRLPVPADQVQRVAIGGAVNRPAAEILAGILWEQLDAIGHEAIREELEEHGAWTPMELDDDDENAIRLVWLAAWDLQRAEM